MNLNDYIMENMSDVDVMDIELAQAFAEMAVLEAMMDCYEKQMVLLEYNEDSANEIFAEQAIMMPELEYIEERYNYYEREDPKSGMWFVARSDSRYNNGRRPDPTQDQPVDANGDPAKGKNVEMYVTKQEALNVAKNFNADERMYENIEKRKHESNKAKKDARKAKKGNGLGLEDMGADQKRKQAAQAEADAKAKRELIIKLMSKSNMSEAEASEKVDRLMASRNKKKEAAKLGLSQTDIASLGITNMDGSTPGSKSDKLERTSSGRAYVAGELPEGEVSSTEDKGSPKRSDIAKKSMSNTIKMYLSKAGDAFLRLGEFIVDSIMAINFNKLGQKFNDSMRDKESVSISATDAAYLNNFDRFIEIVERYGSRYSPSNINSHAGNWTNANVGRYVGELSNLGKELENIGKVESNEEKSVSVEEIVDICNKLGKNEIKKKIREFRRNSASFNTNLNVENGVPEALAKSMKEFIKKLMKAYNAEAKAVKSILKTAKANDAVEENTDNTAEEPVPVTAGEATGESYQFSMNLDEDFFN